MKYVDGFVIPIPRKNITAYRRLAKLSAKIWHEYGALEFRECVGDDLSGPGVRTFTQLAKARRGETVLFSWIVYKSKAHRDQVNKKVMKDPRIIAMMNSKKMPFVAKKMVYGGFKVLVDA
jgi:uncharacterized protein YbaA (DUF1428 family)